MPPDGLSTSASKSAAADAVTERVRPAPLRSVLETVLPQCENGLLAGSLLWWNWRHADVWAARQRPEIAVWLINLLVAGLFLFRTAQRRRASWSGLLQAVPCIVLGGVIFQGAQGRADWPLPLELLFLAGAVWTFVSLATLGRSFGLFPGARQLVASGPYRLVRHPAYLGESVMALAALGIAGSWWTAVLLCCLPVCLVWRIRAEEAVLSELPGYREYCRSVRWRIVPGLW